MDKRIAFFIAHGKGTKKYDSAWSEINALIAEIDIHTLPILEGDKLADLIGNQKY